MKGNEKKIKFSFTCFNSKKIKKKFSHACPSNFFSISFIFVKDITL